MELRVKLQTLLYSLEDYDDGGYGYYIDVETGEEYVVWDELVNNEENDDLINEIYDNPKRYLKLPDWGDLDSFDRMEEFVAAKVTDAKMQKKLTKVIKTIKRKPIFAKFDAEVNAMGILQDWHDFCDDYNERFGRKWCAERNITLVE